MPDDISIRLPMQRSIGSARTPCEQIASDTADSDRGEKAPRPSSLYVHVPFCAHKCHYCDFYSIVDTQDRQEAFTDRLIEEIRAIGPLAGPLETIFVGGGTPSMLRPDRWARVLDAMGEHFDLAAIRAGRGEFSVECNPETVTPELVGTLHAGGVNRISMGAQSFDRRHLETLERRHDPDRLPEACRIVRDAGIRRLSVDLISAVPGQTVNEWDRDLGMALSLGTEHVSAYTLTYEPGTAMTARLGRGEFVKASEDLEADMYEHTVGRLRRAGLERYEVSNYAKPGAECAHNMAYWRQHDWLAIGPGASAHVRGWRWKNTPRLDDYLSQSDGGFAPVSELEEPDRARSLMDRLMTGIRLAEGVDGLRAIKNADRLGRRAEMNAAVQQSIAAGWLTDVSGRWILTESGFLFADRVAGDLIRALI